MLRIKLNDPIRRGAIIGVFLFTGVISIAQVKQENRIAMIQEAVVFMAKVKAKKDYKTIADSNSISINGLVNYSNKNNNIPGLAKLINAWVKSENYKNNNLPLLSQALLKDLTEGSKDKTDRKTKYADIYADFKSKLETLVTDTIKKTALVDKLPARPGPSDKDSTKKGKAITVNPGSDQNNSFMLYLALLSAIVSLGVSIWVHRKQVAVASNVIMLNEKLTGVLDMFAKTNEKFVSNLRDEISIRKTTPIPDKQPIQESSEKIIPQFDKNEEKTYPAAPIDQSVKYAKNSANGGFSVIDLKSQQNGECIFELHIGGNLGTLKLSDDSKVRNYALSLNPEYYFKAEVCDIQGPLSSDKEIVINSNGELKLSDDGSKWIITKKISLTFN